MINEIVITLLFSNVFNVLGCFVKTVKSYLYGFHPLNVKREKIMSTYDFQATVASRGYHVYKETTCSNAKVNEKVKIKIETNQSLIAIDPYACVVKAKEKYFDGWKTVGHVPREISRYIYFFI